MRFQRAVQKYYRPIFLIIAIVTAVSLVYSFGAPTVGEGELDEPVATIYGTQELTRGEYQAALRHARLYHTLVHWGMCARFDEDRFNPPDEHVRETAYELAVLQRLASRLGMPISDDDVRDRIAEMFGETDPRAYGPIVERYFRMSAQEFEAGIRAVLPVLRLIEIGTESQITSLAQAEAPGWLDMAMPLRRSSVRLLAIDFRREDLAGRVDSASDGMVLQQYGDGGRWPILPRAEVEYLLVADEDHAGSREQARRTLEVLRPELAALRATPDSVNFAEIAARHAAEGRPVRHGTLPLFSETAGDRGLVGGVVGTTPEGRRDVVGWAFEAGRSAGNFTTTEFVTDKGFVFARFVRRTPEGRMPLAGTLAERIEQDAERASSEAAATQRLTEVQTRADRDGLPAACAWLREEGIPYRLISTGYHAAGAVPPVAPDELAERLRGLNASQQIEYESEGTTRVAYVYVVDRAAGAAESVDDALRMRIRTNQETAYAREQFPPEYWPYFGPEQVRSGAERARAQWIETRMAEARLERLDRRTSGSDGGGEPQ